MTYTLKELTEKTGVTARTIRYWIAENVLMGPITQGAQASYTEDHVSRIREIQRGQKEGRTLAQLRVSSWSVYEDIKNMFEDRVTHIRVSDEVDVYIKEGLPPHTLRYIRKVLSEMETELRRTK